MSSAAVDARSELPHYLERELLDRIASDPAIFHFLESGSLDGVWYWDLENTDAEWMSPRFWETLGIDPASKSHSPAEWMDLIFPEDLEEAKRILGDHLRDPGVPYDQLVRYRHADGFTVWIRCRGIAIRDAEGVPKRMLGAHTDVTDVIRAREELSAKVGELERSNKALATFAYAASHDLREPLRAVTSFVRMLDEELRPTLSDEQKQYMDFALTGSERMNALINDLLRYAGVNASPINMEPVDLGELIEVVRADLTSAIGANDATLEVGPLPVVSGESGQLRQLFQNLIANAIKFRRDEPVRVRVSAHAQDDWLRIEVADNGEGIPSRFRDRVFQIFQRLHGRAEHEGTGIGLAICKGVVERHGGEIGFDSVEGVGTTFWVTLPKPT